MSYSPSKESMFLLLLALIFGEHGPQYLRCSLPFKLFKKGDPTLWKAWGAITLYAGPKVEHVFYENETVHDTYPLGIYTVVHEKKLKNILTKSKRKSFLSSIHERYKLFSFPLINAWNEIDFEINLNLV